MRFILSYGGGVNSTALYFLIREKKLPLDEVVFADTGSELPETYVTAELMEQIVRGDGIPFTTVRSPLAPSLYDYCLSNNIIPSKMRRDCTGKFKIRPIRNHLREKYGKKERFTSYIGIALEEAHRMRDSDVKYVKNDYPLVDARIDRRGCEKILKSNAMCGVGKSGCFFCPFMKRREWVRLLEEHPTLFDRAISLEENCQRDFTLASIPLRKLKEDRRNQTKLIDFEPSCDVAGSCFL